MATEPVLYNVDKWIQENQSQFLPPVCNKLMHQQGQMKIFFVGGPNQRKDYHIEEGEELFYMLKGDMCLKVIEKGKFVDITIREGEIFLLPAKIAHSPQREANTVGMVIERERLKQPLELDGLRYHVENDGEPTLESLYEAWFYCRDLGKELAPIIKSYFASEQHKTGKPIPDTIPENPPIKLDFHTKLRRPFSLKKWIEENRNQIDDDHAIMFGSSQFIVQVHGPREFSLSVDQAETWLWQLEGNAMVECGNMSYRLEKDDSLLIPIGVKFTLTGGITLLCYQDPSLKR